MDTKKKFRFTDHPWISFWALLIFNVQFFAGRLVVKIPVGVAA